MVRPQGDICSLCCTTLMLLFFQYSVSIACTQRKTTTTVTLPCAYLLNLGACEIIFCLFQITICLAVYCNFFNFNKTFRKMHKHLEYQISCRCQQIFFFKKMLKFRGKRERAKPKWTIRLYNSEQKGKGGCSHPPYTLISSSSQFLWFLIPQDPIYILYLW